MSVPGNPFEPPVSAISQKAKAGRFKKFSLAVLASMVGCGLVLGLIVAAAFLPDVLSSRPDPQTAPRRVEHPPGLVVARSARIEDTDEFSVQGVVENRGSTHWSMVSLDLEVRVAGAKVNGCDTGMSDLAAGARRAFLISCDGTTGKSLPAGTQYRITVDWGYPKRES